MRVLHALFTPALGGLEQAFVNVTEAFSLYGHEVVAVVRGDAPYKSEVAKAAVVVEISPTGFYDLKAIWELRQLIKRVRPDVIVAHAPRAVTLLHIAKLGLGIPLCGVSHSDKIDRMRRADAVVALTATMRDILVKRGYARERIHLIPNSVAVGDMPMFRQHEGVLRIGVMSRLVVEKGVRVFMDACAILKKRGVDFTVKIAGDGADAPALKQKAAELGLPVEWLGWTKDKAAFWRSLDVFCLPSRHETFGITVLEAMANGVPVVATRTAGPEFMLAHGKNGVLVAIGDAEALADALGELAKEPEVGAMLARGGWARVQDFSFPKVAAQWDEVVSAVARKR